jgi:hypothetical protein
MLAAGTNGANAAEPGYESGANGANAAGQPGYEISVGVGRSDNIARVPNGAGSTLLTQGIDFTWHDQRPRFNTDIDADLQYINYFPRDFHSEVIGNFLGALNAALVPDLLYWDVADNFGQGRLDPLTPASPLNRENINYFNTGPDLRVPLLGNNFFALSAQYGNVTYQTSTLDSTRYGGRIAFIHLISQRSAVSLNVSDQRINYRDVQFPDYSTQDVFARLDSRGLRTTLTVDLGYSRLSSSQFPDNGVLARLELSRKISGSSTVAFSVGHQFSDSASAFVLSQTVSGPNLATQGGTQTGVPFKSDYGTVGWNFQRNRTSFGLDASVYKETYLQQSSLDDTRILFDAHFSRLLSPTLTVTLADQFYRQNFTNLDQHASENDINAQLAWRASRRVTLTAVVTHAGRNSNIPNTDFTENRVWFSLSYGRLAPLPPGPATPRLPDQRRY